MTMAIVREAQSEPPGDEVAKDGRTAERGRGKANGQEEGGEAR